MIHYSQSWILFLFSVTCFIWLFSEEFKLRCFLLEGCTRLLPKIYFHTVMLRLYSAGGLPGPAWLDLTDIPHSGFWLVKLCLRPGGWANERRAPPVLPYMGIRVVRLMSRLLVRGGRVSPEMTHSVTGPSPAVEMWEGSCVAQHHTVAEASRGFPGLGTDQWSSHP